ncbi:hypothetical protein [Colwellia hornerae]|uniref:Uncharacterized protein n=1 Tax=Colwellia hornerae TaxID=89402 RepID=A0A5C6QJP0_9GAMM|nr:hypothetical protein [Colwellia hornerae]TWX54059.1 hypothetical protein ESZ28_08380 [Colwellia hornerae]TWX60834.1 hypothetical protein ESZ26_07155 [Colwellia hornerae]TWX69164.1 hypothetical protein ESZ27_05915 [Colwellia hornerae]
MKPVIYIISTPLSLRDYRRYGIEELQNKNVDVDIVDISSLIYPDKYKGNNVRSCDFCNVSYVSKVQDLDLFINQRRVDHVYITIGFLPKRILFKLMKKGSKVAVQMWGPIPLAHVGTHRFISRIKKPIVITKKIMTKLYEQVKYGNIEYDYYLSVDEVKNKQNILCHSYDYYLHLLDANNVKNQSNSNSSVVFLDQMLPYHPDFSLSGIKNTINSRSYYQKLNDYFSFVENKLKVRVVIAAHPRSIGVENYSELFQGRDVIIGMTNQLISEALFTITHYSTAINYSVINNKKIVYLLSSELISIGMKNQLELMAFETDSEIVNIDITDGFYQGNNNNNNNKYKEYKKKYITQRCDDITNGQIIINELLVNN